jgi:hypothetical protein
VRVERLARASRTLAFLVALACAGSSPAGPRQLVAGLDPGMGPERRSEPFAPQEAQTRFCRVRDLLWSVGFDGHWTLSLSARCEKRLRYGDCACQARVRAEADGRAVMETPWRRFDVHNGSGWMEFSFGGSARETRFAYPELDRVVVTLEDLDVP